MGLVGALSSRGTLDLASRTARPSNNELDLKMRSLSAGLVLVSALTGCGPGELFVTKRGKVTGRIETADNRAGVPCEVTHRLFDEEDGGAMTVPSGQDATRVVSVTTQLRPPVPFHPRVALVARCAGYESAVSAVTEIEIGYLTTPETRVEPLIARPAMVRPSSNEGPSNDAPQRTTPVQAMELRR
jgi:hypothetical protein